MILNVLVLTLIALSTINASPIERESAVPLVEESDEKVISTLCQTASQFKYYLPHPSNSVKYVVCDPWGTGLIRSCPEGQLFDQWALKCSLLDEVRNMTFTMPTIEQPQTTLTCNSSESLCLNNGVCFESSGSLRCMCSSEFTGQFCESAISSQTSLYSEIMNGTFSYREFQRQLIELNVTRNDATQYERYKEILDKDVYDELMKYLLSFGKDEVRFDLILNELIEDVLEDIYPDAEYLASFNASSQQIVDMVRFIPNLLSYAKYSFERYEVVFQQYRTVLDRLLVLLNTTEPVLRTHAFEYSQLTAMILNRTQETSETSQVFSQMDGARMSESDVRTTIGSGYNSTLESTQRLFKLLDRFQTFVTEELVKNPKTLGLTLGESKFPICSEVLEIFKEISTFSAQIWENLVQYGFWYVTGGLAGSLTVQ